MCGLKIFIDKKSTILVDFLLFLRYLIKRSILALLYFFSTLNQNKKEISEKEALMNDLESVQKRLDRALQERLPERWLNSIKVELIDGDTMHLSCRNEVCRQLLSQHSEAIKGAVNEASNNSSRFLKYTMSVVPVTESEKPKGKSCEHRPGIQKQLPSFASHVTARLVKTNMTFDGFVEDDRNRLASQAARSVASKKSIIKAPVFLLSKTGLGKSHLTYAAGHSISTNNPGARIRLITASEFSEELVRAIRSDSLEQFKKGYLERCDILLMEDVHFLGGKERTQIEIARVLDFLTENKRKIILSSRFAPQDIPKLSDELRSRFSQTMISNMEPPRFNSRVRILRKNLDGQRIPEEVLELLADSFPMDMRELKGSLISVIAHSSLLGCDINLALASEVVKIIGTRRKKITINVIKKVVCKAFGISVSEIEARTRKQGIVWPRQIAMYLAREFTDAPLTVIAKHFNRYHATALYAINSVKKAIRTDPSKKEQIELLSKKLEEGDF